MRSTTREYDHNQKNGNCSFNPNLKVTSGSSSRVIDPIYLIRNLCVDILPVKERAIKKMLLKLVSLKLGVQCVSFEVPKPGKPA